MTRSAVFLDRDGTLNVDRDYVYRREDWEWIPGVKEALGLLSSANFLLVVISNQSGIGRGYYRAEDVDKLHRKISLELAAEGIVLERFYYCPHGPNDGCACRKPKAGLIFRAQKELGIDLSTSYLVGDKAIDVEAGRTAGVRSLMVATGYGRSQQALVPNTAPFFDDLLAAARWILADQRGEKP